MEEFDVVVIGAGPGGYPAAIRSAQLGASTALVEKELLGGVCLNWGCIPTKALIAGAGLWREIKSAGEFGIAVKDASFDYAAMARRKDAVVGKLRAGIEGLLKANKVSVFKGVGAFASRNLIDVASGSGGETRLKAGRVIISTGSRSAFPPGIRQGPLVMDSRSFLESGSLPKSILVLGGGVIGCEMACLCAALGVETTVVEMLEDLLAPLDPDLRRELRRSMEKDLGIRVITGAPMEKVSTGADSVSAEAAGKKLSAERMLVAVGRKPFLDGLDIEKAGLRANARGYVEVNDMCETAVPGIYAAGDVTGFSQLAHAATAQGTTAAENAAGRRASMKGRPIPSCIFTMPEIGTIGMGERDAAEKGLEVKVGKFHFAALGRALAQGSSQGFVKLVADARTDQALGAAAIGAHAVELVAEAAAAVASELTAAELGRIVHAHPTMSEAWMEAAHSIHGLCVHAAPKQARKAR